MNEKKTVTKSYHEIDYHVTINCPVNDNSASVLLHVISKNKMYKTFAFVTVFVKIGQTTFAVCKNPEIHSPKTVYYFLIHKLFSDKRNMNV